MSSLVASVYADSTEWEFINNLAFRSQLSEEQAHFVKLMYRTKLKKVSIWRHTL